MPDSDSDRPFSQARKSDLLSLLSERLDCPVESLNFIFGYSTETDFEPATLKIPDQRFELQ